MGQLLIRQLRRGYDRVRTPLFQVYQTYDGAGQLVGQYWYGGTAGYSESYTYDPTSGALSSMVTGSG